MTTHNVTIGMNGVTGRMGTNQHLERSIVAIRDQGGVKLADGDRIMPHPMLLGRNEEKLRELADRYGIEKWSIDVQAAMADPTVDIYFDAQTTSLRPESVQQAIAAGKHIYCEKPLALDVDTAQGLLDQAGDVGVKHGIVQDKLFLPGIQKLQRLLVGDFFGRVLSVRGEFGYWVFEGFDETPQRPSWNYRRQDGGGIMLDMLPHWQYLLEQLFGRINSVSCLGVTHIPERHDERGEPYEATADDAVYATFLLEGGIVVQINSSWATRVYRDELVMFQVDGTSGSAVAGLTNCRIQPRGATPRPVWNPDIPNSIDFRSGWLDTPSVDAHENGFKLQWEAFLRHVVADEPFPWGLDAGVRGLQLVDAAATSWHERCWVDVPGVG